MIYIYIYMSYKGWAKAGLLVGSATQPANSGVRHLLISLFRTYVLMVLDEPRLRFLATTIGGWALPNMLSIAKWPVMPNPEAAPMLVPFPIRSELRSMWILHVTKVVLSWMPAPSTSRPGTSSPVTSHVA